MKNHKLIILAAIVTLLLTGCTGGINDSISQETNSNIQDKSKSGETTLVVGTFNIDAKSVPDVEAQSKLMTQNGVEVVGIQEVDNSTIRNKRDMLKEFAANQFVDYFYTNCIDYEGGEYGIGIASKYKIVESSYFKLFSDEFYGRELAEELAEAYRNYDPDNKESSDYLDEVSAKGAIEPRCLQRIVIEKDGKQIAFYNTHLSWEDETLRAQQMEEIKNTLDNDDCKYKIVVGDFNADQTTMEYNVFKDNYNLANGNNGVWIDTYAIEYDSMNVYSIDNIIVSKNIEINSVKRVVNDLSDHYPLVVELALK